jgi:hypothetical protein
MRKEAAQFSAPPRPPSAAVRDLGQRSARDREFLEDRGFAPVRRALDRK